MFVFVVCCFKILFCCHAGRWLGLDVAFGLRRLFAWLVLAARLRLGLDFVYCLVIRF